MYSAITMHPKFSDREIFGEIASFDIKILILPQLLLCLKHLGSPGQSMT